MALSDSDRPLKLVRLFSFPEPFYQPVQTSIRRQWRLLVHLLSPLSLFAYTAFSFLRLRGEVLLWLAIRLVKNLTLLRCVVLQQLVCLACLVVSLRPPRQLLTEHGNFTGQFLLVYQRQLLQAGTTTGRVLITRAVEVPPVALRMGQVAFDLGLLQVQIWWEFDRLVLGLYFLYLLVDVVGIALAFFDESCEGFLLREASLLLIEDRSRLILQIFQLSLQHLHIKISLLHQLLVIMRYFLKTLFRLLLCIGDYFLLLFDHSVAFVHLFQNYLIVFS